MVLGFNRFFLFVFFCYFKFSLFHSDQSELSKQKKKRCLGLAAVADICLIWVRVVFGRSKTEVKSLREIKRRIQTRAQLFKAKDIVS